MVVLNNLDRYHLAMDVIDRVPSLGTQPATARGSGWPTSGSGTGRTSPSTARTSPGTGVALERLVTRLLVVNAGSSSIKLRVLGDDDGVAGRAGRVRLGRRRRVGAGRRLSPNPSRRDRAPGGARRRGLRRRRTGRRRRGQPAGGAGLVGAAAPAPGAGAAAAHPEALPDVPDIACFDTAFHGRCRRQLPPTPCRRTGGIAGGYAGTASTACPISTSPPAPPSWYDRDDLRVVTLPPRRGRIAVRRRPTAVRSTPAWASPRSRGW